MDVRKFFLMEENRKGITPWDSLLGTFDSFSAVKSAAEDEWDHLTYHERRERRIRILSAVVPDNSENPFNDALEIHCGFDVELEDFTKE